MNYVEEVYERSMNGMCYVWTNLKRSGVHPNSHCFSSSSSRLEESSSEPGGLSGFGPKEEIESSKRARASSRIRTSRSLS